MNDGVQNGGVKDAGVQVATITIATTITPPSYRPSEGQSGPPYPRSYNISYLYLADPSGLRVLFISSSPFTSTPHIQGRDMFIAFVLHVLKLMN